MSVFSTDPISLKFPVLDINGAHTAQQLLLAGTGKLQGKWLWAGSGHGPVTDGPKATSGSKVAHVLANYGPSGEKGST